MATRVSTRLRTRTDDIWSGLSPVDGPAAQFAEDGFVGPFTPAQFAELFWRVKEIIVSWEITYDPGDGAVTASGTSYLRRQNLIFTDVADETELIAANPPHNEYYNIFQFRWFEQDSLFDFGGTCDVTIEKDVWGRDENGKFWLQFDIIAGDYSGSVITSVDEDLGVPAPSTLNLTTGSVNIPTRAIAPAPGTISAATVTVEITEWFPYKTTAGAPAWNTSTGEPVNGGPGA